MLFAKCIALFAVVASVTASPHGHVKTSGGVGDASSCPCGTAPNDAGDCVALDCPTDATCVNSDGQEACSNTLPPADGIDNYLGKKKKTCRFNNDASCHKCASTSCQYQYGNYWGSGFPCIDSEGLTTFDNVAFNATNDEGAGESHSFTAYGMEETIDFCNTDEYEINMVGVGCALDKIPVIVSPKTCTHCQVTRCLSITADLSRYDAWNPIPFDQLASRKSAYAESATSQKEGTTIN